MTIREINLVTESDADLRQSFVYTVDDVATDLTGATMLLKLRRPLESITVALTLTTENGGIVITDAEAGEFNLIITAAQLEQLAPGVYEQSMVVTQGGARTLAWRGQLTHTLGPSR